MKLDFNSYIARKTDHFAGREWVFQEVNDWLSNNDATRNFLVTGDPGSGKSAIAARLTQFSLGMVSASPIMPYISPGFLSAVHFCSVHDLRWINPHVFTESLALQMAARYPVFARALAEKSGDRQINIEVVQEVQTVNGGQVTGIIIQKLDVSAISPQDAFIRVVREPLETLINQGFDKSIVILVDSLDESLQYSGADNIASLLSKTEHLPSNVHFILTSRLENDIIRSLGHKSFECSLTSTERLSKSHEDIERFIIRSMTEHPEMANKFDSEISQEEVTIAIRNKSEGNFLYVNYLLEMLIQNQAKISRRSIDQLPNGLDGIYIEFLDRLIEKDMKAWANMYGPVLGTLAVARSALTETQISAFVKMDKPEVRILLQKMRQLLDTDESMPASQRVYSTYHRSFADFLLNEDRAEEYWCEDICQHERIVRYYVDNFHISWNDCDNYGLSQLVSHMQFLVDQKQSNGKKEAYARELFLVIMDESFRQAQIEHTGDPLITLTCLRTALDNSIKKDDVVEMISCVGAIHETKKRTSLTKTIFDAVAAGDFKRASERGRIFWGDEWTGVLNLYVAWEAAESGNIYAAEGIIVNLGNKSILQLGNMGEALIVRIARRLAQKIGVTFDAKSLLVKWGREADAGYLLRKYSLASKLDESALQKKLDEVEKYLNYLEQTISEGAAEGAYMDSERAGVFSDDILQILSLLAANDDGQAAIDRALESVLGNPYPQYRDIALNAIGTAVICVPDPFWVRQRIHRILFTTIESEGVTFTFDLPSILLSEARRRNLRAPELEVYIEKALRNDDRWGTIARARSARAAAIFFEGDVVAAFEELEKADQLNIGMAGYSTLTILSFADRCHEFGQAERALSAVWGYNKDISLINGAMGVAQRVRDPKFRSERIKLVEEYNQAFKADHQGCYSIIFNTIFMDPERDKVLLSLLSARNCWPPDKPKWEALKSLTPIVLDSVDDSTALDALLARIVRLRIKKMNDSEVEELVRVCEKYLTTGRPWEFGQWDRRVIT
jgi:hypothetical protein